MLGIDPRLFKGEHKGSALAIPFLATSITSFSLGFIVCSIFSDAGGAKTLFKMFRNVISSKPTYIPLPSALLNLKVDTRAATRWINLGLWSHQNLSYAAACENLCVFLGRQLELQANDKLVDVGCGNGDSLVLWLDKFKIHARGVNSCETEVKCCQARGLSCALASATDDGVYSDGDKVSISRPPYFGGE